MSKLLVQQVPASPGRPASAARREARVRPEHAHRYPGIDPGRWESAAILADRIVAARLLGGGPVAFHGRAVSDEHFEFRGGSRAPDRPRREDR